MLTIFEIFNWSLTLMLDFVVSKKSARIASMFAGYTVTGLIMQHMIPKAHPDYFAGNVIDEQTGNTLSYEKLINHKDPVIHLGSRFYERTSQISSRQ